MTKNDLMNICHRGVGDETNEWVYGYFVNAIKEFTKDERVPQIITYQAIVSPPNVFHKAGIAEVKQETVGRYIGMTDRYGSMIFEGDLIQIDGCTYGQLLEVRFMDGLFVGYIEGQTPLWLPLFAKHIRVVDNLWHIKENSMLQSIESDKDAEDLCWEWD